MFAGVSVRRAIVNYALGILPNTANWPVPGFVGQPDIDCLPRMISDLSGFDDLSVLGDLT